MTIIAARSLQSQETVQRRPQARARVKTRRTGGLPLVCVAVACKVLVTQRYIGLVDFKTNRGTKMASPWWEETRARLCLAPLTAADVAKDASDGPDDTRQLMGSACRTIGDQFGSDARVQAIACYFALIAAKAAAAAGPVRRHVVDSDHRDRPQLGRIFDFVVASDALPKTAAR